MTLTQILELISITGYDALLIGGVGLLFWNMFTNYDDALNLFWQGEHDLAWLLLFLIPVEMCVLIVWLIKVTPFISL